MILLQLGLNLKKRRAACAALALAPDPKTELVQQLSCVLGRVSPFLPSALRSEENRKTRHPVSHSSAVHFSSFSLLSLNIPPETDKTRHTPKHFATEADW